MKRLAVATAAVLIAFAWTPLLGGSAAATFPGPIGRLAFASDRDGPVNIYTMNPDGTNPARVTTGSTADTGPAWDPRGWNIVYVATRARGDSDIQRIDDTGGIVKDITDDRGVVNRSPGYDIDKDVIIFETDRDGNSEIYSMRDNGKDPRNLTHHPRAEDIDPAVSSTGRVAFASDRHRDNFEIFTMNLDGSVVERLTPVPDDQRYDNIQPAWSPHGDRIAFVSDRGESPSIFVMRADGSNLVRLTDDLGADHNPTWSPDGTMIAFDTDRHGNREIYVMRPDGSSQTRITNNGINDFEPAWQRVNKERHAFGETDREVSDAREPRRQRTEGGSGVRVSAPEAAEVRSAPPASAAEPSPEPAAEPVRSDAQPEPEVVTVVVARDVAEPAASGETLRTLAVALTVVASSLALTSRRRSAHRRGA